MAVGYSKVFNARYLVTQCSRLFRGNSVLLPSFLLSFSLFFFADDTDHDTLATNLVHPSLPSLSPVSRVSYATEEAIVGSSAMFRYLIPEHFFPRREFSRRDTAPPPPRAIVPRVAHLQSYVYAA